MHGRSELVECFVRSIPLTNEMDCVSNARGSLSQCHVCDAIKCAGLHARCTDVFTGFVLAPLQGWAILLGSVSSSGSRSSIGSLSSISNSISRSVAVVVLVVVVLIAKFLL